MSPTRVELTITVPLETFKDGDGHPPEALGGKYKCTLRYELHVKFTYADNVVQFQYILDNSNLDHTLGSSTLFYMLHGTQYYIL